MLSVIGLLFLALLFAGAGTYAYQYSTLKRADRGRVLGRTLLYRRIYRVE
jgi:hypothetical protein